MDVVMYLVKIKFGRFGGEIGIVVESIKQVDTHGVVY